MAPFPCRVWSRDRLPRCRTIVVLRRTIPNKTVLHRAVPRRVFSLNAVPCRTEPRRAVPCRVSSLRAIPCRTEPCRAVPCRAVPCRAVSVLTRAGRRAGLGFGAGQRPSPGATTGRHYRPLGAAFPRRVQYLIRTGIRAGRSHESVINRGFINAWKRWKVRPSAVSQERAERGESWEKSA